LEATAPVRLGAVRALGRLVQGNPSLRETVIEVICAYLRMPYDAGRVIQAIA